MYAFTTLLLKVLIFSLQVTLDLYIVKQLWNRGGGG